MYDLNIINENLKTVTMGRTIVQYDLLPSTFIKAKSIYDSCSDGTVILSENQSQCTMRMGNAWYCQPDKNIYLSIILKPAAHNLTTSKFDIINSASLCKTIEELYGTDCKIKWPNNILIKEKKISSFINNYINKGNGVYVVSFGINANAAEGDFSLISDMENKWTSLMIEIGSHVERELFIAELLNNFEKFYNDLINKNSMYEAMNLYEQNLYGINSEVEIMRKGKKTKTHYFIEGINEDGYLSVTDKKENKQTLNPGEMIVTYDA